MSLSGSLYRADSMLVHQASHAEATMLTVASHADVRRGSSRVLALKKLVGQERVTNPSERLRGWLR